MMLHSCQNNNIVKHLHERSRWLIYNDESSCYDERHRNMQPLAIETLKV